MFEPKDFESLYRLKLRSGFDKDSDFDLSSSYFFNLNNKIIFLKRFRKLFKIMASSNCGFEPMARESCFDILFVSPDFSSTVSMFKSYIQRLIME